MKKLLFYVLSLLLVCSCTKNNDDEPNDYISFVGKEIQAFTEAKTYTVDVSVINEFTVSVDPAAAGWCRAEVNEKTVVIYVDENLSGNERTAVITATSGKLTDQLRVVQGYYVTGQFEIKVFPDEKNRVSFALFNCNSAIDWGDGKEEVFGDNEPDGTTKRHTYADRDEKTIKITTRVQVVDKEAKTIDLRVNHSSEGKFNAFHFEKYAYPIAITCSGLGLESLDVTNLEKLRYLDCYNNGLTSLDISKNLELVRLDCAYNQISKLDTRSHSHFEEFKCNKNQLTELDLSNSLRLDELHCSQNQLVQLKVNSSELAILNCWENRLTSLDLNKCTSLYELSFHTNQLSALDVSKNTKLVTLVCSENQLTSLDVSNNTSLSVLFCSKNQLTSLDVSKTILNEMFCEYNQLSGAALNALFQSLPTATVPAKGPYRIYIEGNPGIAESDKMIANNRGWRVIELGSFFN